MIRQFAYGSADAAPLFRHKSEMGALIAAHDWGATPLGPIQIWPPHLATTVRVMLAAKAQIVMFWGREFIALYNDAYAPTIGTKHPGALGRPARESWAELWDDLEPLLSRVRRTGDTVAATDRPFVIEREKHPENVFFDISYSAVSDADGVCDGVLCIVNETTHKVLANRRLSFQLALGDRLRILTAPPDMMAQAAEMLGRHLGVGRVGYAEIDATGAWVTTERDWTDGDMPSFAGTHRLDDFGPKIVGEFRDGRTVALDDVRTDPRTAASVEAFVKTGMRAGVAAPLIKDGRFAAAIYAHQRTPRHWTKADIDLVVDVGERTWDAVRRARSEAALRASEARRSAIFSQSPVGISEIGLDGRFLDVNGALCGMLGRSREDVVGRSIAEFTHPADLPANLPLFERTAATGEPFSFDKRYVRSDGSHVWATSSVARLLDEHGNPRAILAVTVDSSERKRADEDRELLINELNHRVKNTLATVQSIAAQTLKGARTTAEARQSFEERLMALSRAHDVLTRENWEGARLGDVVDVAVAPYRSHREGRFSIDGPPVRLTPRKALALAMALQELATNAVKYGALSNDCGAISISWRVSDDLLGPHILSLRWCENGGPPVKAPARRGFGSRLLERSLAQDLGGDVSLKFAESGLVCEISAPLAD